MGSSTELEAGSQGQLDNLVAILKAFPDAKVKIGGYTDKTGNEASNVKLSQARADFIKAALAKAGVGAQVLGAEGYGSKFATVDAKASDAERAADRKMSVRFAK
ncbi:MULTISPECIES: OmpA family protein [unclassified Chryseobacterium]|uniref:OmpA family protein n=1 Tax=unclassified Chryseobacterium TaxID=2593645 RepID=UPI0026D05A2A|nr:MULTISPECIES: OmpA family protein [unclassified Chryseobacterium]